MIAVLVGAALWGVIGVFVRNLTAMGYSSHEIIFVRTLMTTGAVFAWLAIKNPKAVTIAPRDAWSFFGAGVLSFVFFNLCYLQCIAVTGMSVAAVLLYTAPVFVMVFSLLLFHEKMTKAKGIALVLAVGGCALVTGILGDHQVSVLGILLGLGAGFGYSLYSVFCTYGLRRYSPLTVIAWAFLFGTLGILPLVDFGHFIATLQQAPWGIFLLLLCGVVCNVIPYALYTWGLAHLEASQASIIACIEPVVATVVGVALYKEPLTATSLLGMVMVIGAVMVLNGPSTQEE